MNKQNNLAIIVLAAGSSSRLKSDLKQLLLYKNKSLLEIAVEKALYISKNVFVVLGHNKPACEKQLENLNVNILYNKNYMKGIGSSISFGIKHTKEFDFTMIILCDQPFIPNKHLEVLKKNIQDESIIASQYSQSKSSSVPAIFPKKYYKELELLKEDVGAKALLKKYSCKNIILDTKFAVDIDTKEDVKLYIS